MVEISTVDEWVDGYVRAWQTNDPQDVGGLFAEDAMYLTAPWRDPWVSRTAIVGGWLERADDQGTWTFRHEVLGVDGDTAFVRGWTSYGNGSNFSNLWVVGFRDGLATSFTEWWMEER